MVHLMVRYATAVNLESQRAKMVLAKMCVQRAKTVTVQLIELSHKNEITLFRYIMLNTFLKYYVISFR